jgi:uracil-DNA glycosylase family 4
MESMANTLEVLQAEAAFCARCHDVALLYAEGDRSAYPLFQKNPPWPVRVMVVGEAPNFDDSFDQAKRRLTIEPETDPSGAFMFELLGSVGLKPNEVLFTNSVLCLPAKNGEGKYPVSARQQDLCADWLGRFIDVADPEVVVTFGGKALEALGRLERHGLTLGEGSGKLHPWRGRRLLALYHPSRLGRVTRPEAMQRADISVLRELLARAPARAAKPRIPEMLAGVHTDGARLVMQSKDGGSFTDLAFRIGAQLGPTPVFAFQVPLPDGPPFWRDIRVFIEGTVKRGDKTVIACRHEEGICEITVHPLTDDERAAVDEWTRSLPDGVLEDMKDAMDDMLDPRAL